MRRRTVILTFAILILVCGGQGLRIFAQPEPRTTKPAFKDTDGDGYPDGPDVVLYVPGLGWRRYIGEDKNGNGKYEPAGDDGILGTADDEYDPNNKFSHPTVPAMSDDTDGDGLSDELEIQIGTDPLDFDTDDDGLSDGDEYYGRGACVVEGWGYHTDPLNPDTDGDGIPDGTELGVYTPIPSHGPILGTDLNTTFTFLDYTYQLVPVATFIPDQDQGATFTDPTIADTNGDGIIDGWQDKNKDGVVEWNGIDNMSGTSDDESDPAIGLRSDPAGLCGYLDGSRTMIFHMYDEGDPNLVDPPPKGKNLYFYWGSSDASSAVWSITPQGTSPAQGIEITANAANNTLQRVSGTRRQPLAFIAAPFVTEADSYLITFSLAAATTPAALSTYQALLSSYHEYPITSTTSVSVITSLGLFTLIEVKPPEAADILPVMDYLYGFSGTNSFSKKTAGAIKSEVESAHGAATPNANDWMASQLGIRFLIRPPLSSEPLTLTGASGLFAAPDVSQYVDPLLGSSYYSDPVTNLPTALASMYRSHPLDCEFMELLQEYAQQYYDKWKPDDSVRRQALQSREHIDETTRLINSIGLDFYFVPYVGSGAFGITDQNFAHDLQGNRAGPANSNIYLGYEFFYDNPWEYHFYRGAAPSTGVPAALKKLQGRSIVSMRKTLIHETMHWFGLAYHTALRPSGPGTTLEWRKVYGPNLTIPINQPWVIGSFPSGGTPLKDLNLVHNWETYLGTLAAPNGVAGIDRSNWWKFYPCLPGPDSFKTPNETASIISISGYIADWYQFDPILLQFVPKQPPVSLASKGSDLKVGYDGSLVVLDGVAADIVNAKQVKWEALSHTLPYNLVPFSTNSNNPTPPPW